MKEKAILVGPIVAEFGWEILRVAPHAIFHKLNNPNNKFIILTRRDRFDIYGSLADKLISLKIDGDGTAYKANCFRLDGYSNDKYQLMVKRFRQKYEEDYEIVKHIFPKLKGRDFANKNQFPQKKMKHNFYPRVENELLVNSWIPSDKPIIVLGPRFRNGMPRNWKYWPELYDMIDSDPYFKKFTIVLCGKRPDYIPDNQNRFYDINDLNFDNNTSLIGVAIEIIRRAKICCGSQSGIPNLSNLLKTPTIQWGHQEFLHTKKYNIYNTPTYFLQCNSKKHFNAISPQAVFKELKLRT